MAPKRKVTPYRELSKEEKEEGLLSRGRNLKRKRVRAAIIEVIDNNEEALSEVADWLTTMGYIRPAHAPKVAKNEPASPSSSKDMMQEGAEKEDFMTPVKEELGQGLENDLPADSPATPNSRLRVNAQVQDANPQNWVAHKYMKLSNCSLTF